MAIKFRCSHCRQLLGISTTKAGTVVDCPACGRSVSVPNEDGAATRTGHNTRPGDHAGLLDALTELTTFGVVPGSQPEQSPASPKPVARAERPPVSRAASEPSDSCSTTVRDVARIIPLTGTHRGAATDTALDAELAESAGLSAAENSAPLIVPELLEPDLEDQDSTPLDETPASPHRREADTSSQAFPRDLASALQDLAATVPAVPTSAETLARRPPAEPLASGRHFLMRFMLFLPAFAVGLLLGTFWQSHNPPVTPRQESSSDKSPADITAPLAADQRSLAGVVRWTDDSGNSSADAGALILLLPAENSTRLRLDGRPLRDASDSTARNAVEAALQMLGASVHQADDTGTWSARVPVRETLTMIVVSRHRSRADGQPVPPGILDTLNQWFDTPLHVLGRLSAEQQIIPSAADIAAPEPTLLNVEFKTQK